MNIMAAVDGLNEEKLEHSGAYNHHYLSFRKVFLGNESIRKCDVLLICCLIMKFGKTERTQKERERTGRHRPIELAEYSSLGDQLLPEHLDAESQPNFYLTVRFHEISA
jgi:hypothetical protein